MTDLQKSYLYKIDKDVLEARERSINALGFSLESPQAELIRSMTNAFYSMGLNRTMEIITLYLDKKITKEDLVSEMERVLDEQK